MRLQALHRRPQPAKGMPYHPLPVKMGTMIYFQLLLQVNASLLARAWGGNELLTIETQSWVANWAFAPRIPSERVTHD